jgi:hypothetical protein
LVIPGRPVTHPRPKDVRQCHYGIGRGFRRQRGLCLIHSWHEVEARADHEADADLPGGDVRPHDAGKRVAIGQRERGETELGGAQHQLLRVRSAAQEREVAGDLQLGVIDHGLGRRTVAPHFIGFRFLVD